MDPENRARIADAHEIDSLLEALKMKNAGALTDEGALFDAEERRRIRCAIRLKVKRIVEAEACQ
jgi:hypothetical protein